MNSVLFECPECGKHLCVNKSSIGKKFNCVACGKPIKAPPAKFAFNCPECDAVLLASKSAIATIYTCPACNKDIPVPLKDPQTETQPIVEAQKEETPENRDTPKYVRREIGEDGIIPMAKPSEKEQEKYKQRIFSHLEKMEADKTAKAMAPAYITLKVLILILCLWGLYALFMKVFPHPLLARGMFILTVCIVVPFYFKAKFLFGDTD